MTIVTVGIDPAKNVFAVHCVDATGKTVCHLWSHRAPDGTQVRHTVLVAAKNKTDPISRWASNLAARRGYWRASVAIAAKNARMCWAALHRGDAFKLPV